jgi:hypothetical protein
MILKEGFNIKKETSENMPFPLSKCESNYIRDDIR